MARVDIFQPKTNFFTQKIARRKIQKVVDRTVRRAKQRALRYTGNSTPTPNGSLARSIHGRVQVVSKFGVTGTVYSDHPKADLLHEGAQPHIIRPHVVRLGSGAYLHNRGGLKFFWRQAGKWVCIKGPVRHPGFVAKKFLSVPFYQEALAEGFRVQLVPGTSRFQRSIV
jgi:hypothetical protein